MGFHCIHFVHSARAQFDWNNKYKKGGKVDNKKYGESSYISLYKNMQVCTSLFQNNQCANRFVFKDDNVGG